VRHVRCRALDRHAPISTFGAPNAAIATISNLYLIHQQGTKGAEEHVMHPERIAWKSMCASDEGKEKGETWCRNADWGNTLPDVKQAWKSVDNLTSGAFVRMWQTHIDEVCARYSAGGTTSAAG
jgi:hypothetical protein